jgi:hypothetical protein
MSVLIVPINVAALAVGEPDTQAGRTGGPAQNLAPMADFSQLPWVAEGQHHNRGPYTSAAALLNAEPFQGAVPLPQGIHLHWALPDGLTAGVAGPDGPTFPNAPNRWLVTRIVVSAPSGRAATTTMRSWVVESDLLNDDATAPAGLNQPNVALSLQDKRGNNIPGRTFAYLGQAFDLATWSEGKNGTRRLTPFTALGYGEPTFAAFYPNCSTVFGFYDTLVDLTDYDPSNSTISYHVVGWYSDPTADPLAQPKATPATYGWSVPHNATPTSTICTGVMDAVPWNPAKAYLTDTPLACSVAIGASTREALSALLANILQEKSPGQYDTAEQILNALQFGLLSGSTNQINSLATFEENVHGAGFATLSSGPLWTVSRVGGKRDDPSVGGEVTLSVALAGKLNRLNVTQLQLNDTVFNLQALQFQLFVDWYKYQMIENAPSQVPARLQNATGAVHDYLLSEVNAIGTAEERITTLRSQVKIQSDALAAALPAGLTLSSRTNAPRYYLPADPVLILSGPDVKPTERYGNDGAGSADGMLACRTNSDVIVSVTLAAGLVKGSVSVVLAAGVLPRLAGQPPGAPAAELQALLSEAFFLAAGLQPSLAAAVAAQGGPGNPATLDLTGTVKALRAATNDFINGVAPKEVVFAGFAPAALYYDIWNGTPWLPILLQYNVQFTPVRYLDPNGSESSPSYPPSFIEDNFEIDDSSIDLRYKGQLPTIPQEYEGTAILTPSAHVDLATQISTFIRHAGADPELQAVLDDLVGPPRLPILAQGLTGASEAFLMRGLTLQMPVGDPATSLPLRPFVQKVKDAVGRQNRVAPLPENSFNPIRTGLLTVTNVRLIDVFGRFKDENSPNVVVAKGLAPPPRLSAPAGTAFLPPRITQPSRLLFRWRAADDREVETNASPATSPVLGWVIPNYLDQSLQIYAAAGLALGELALSADKLRVLWTPAPGGRYPIGTPIGTVFQGQNADLAAFAKGTYNNGDATFFAPFFAAVREALTFSLPRRFAESAQQAVLTGQPLALARARLSLDLAGPAATDESWTGFANVVLDNATPSDAGVSQVEFPVSLGALMQLDDTMLGYWVAPQTPADYRTFYAPSAKNSQGGVAPPTQSTLTLTPGGQSDGGKDVVVLMDPRGCVHATTGILPVKQIDIPPSQYADALAALGVCFEVAPILSGTNAPAAHGGAPPMVMIMPKVSSGTWNWVTTNGTDWAVVPLSDAATAKATLNYSPQQISEGWLRLTKPGTNS